MKKLLRTNCLPSMQEISASEGGHKIGCEMVQLDSSIAQPIAKEEAILRSGAEDTGQAEACPVSEAATEACGEPWCYMFIHNREASKFSGYAEREAGFRTFVHRTLTYGKGGERAVGDIADGRPTISGLLFIQGNARRIRRYLGTYFPQYHLVNDCSTHETAVIPDGVMQAFMRVSKADPMKIRFLLNPLKHYSRGNTLVRVLTGPMAGLEGYVIRIDRDRRLVIGVGDMTVAIGGVHREQFEAVEAVAREVSRGIDPDRDGRSLTAVQESIDRSLFVPGSFNDVLVLAANLELWQERAEAYVSRRMYGRAAEILPFLLEEIGYYFTGLYGDKSLDIAPVLNAGRRISRRISAMLDDHLVPEDIRISLRPVYDEQAVRHGYMFM